MQIPELTANYHAATYWAAFGVILGLSFVGLFFFSRVFIVASERMDRGSELMVNWVVRRAVGWWRRKKAPPHEEEDE